MSKPTRKQTTDITPPNDTALLGILLAKILAIYPHTLTSTHPHSTRLRTRPDTKLPGGQALAWRYDTTLTLTKWARLALTRTEHTKNNPNHHPIHTWDVHALIGLHLGRVNWWTTQPEINTLITELTHIHTTGLNLIHPPEHQPLVGQHPDCGGTIRANTGTQPLQATCDGCHQTLAITWWAKLLPTTGITTLPGLIGPLALQGHTTTTDKLRRLADRGILPTAGHDHKGRRLFDVPTAVDAYLAHKATRGRLRA